MPTPELQLLSRTVYNTDGATENWDFSFADGYLDQSHVKARTETATGVRTEITVTPAMLIGPYQLRITPALAAGLVLTIYRDTPKNAPLVNFADESGFSEVALDTNARQAVMVAAETADEVNTSAISQAVTAAESALASANSASTSASSAAASASSAATSASSAAASATTVSTVLPYLTDIEAVSDNIGAVTTAASNITAIAAAPGAASTAQAAAAAAQAAAGQAAFAILRGLGFTNSTAYDYGFVADTAVAHPTDYGTL